MISWLIETLFNIVKFIWNAPTWAVVLVIVIFFAVLYYFGIFDSSSGTNGSRGEEDKGSGSSYTNKMTHINFDKPEQPFVFYDYNGDRRGRGDCFYDSKGCRRSWGDGFYDGKGFFRNWGESYYDSHGYFRSWGDCFYDTQGNLVYPD